MLHAFQKFFSGISIFRNLCTYINYNIICSTYAMRHGIVLSAMDSSTMDSSTLNSSAMDSSAIGVGVAVLVGKCMQGPWSAVPDIRIRYY